MKKNTVKLILMMAFTALFVNLNAQTIYDIQYSEMSLAVSPYVDQEVTTTGIVTAESAQGYWIQDGVGAWNGIYVFDSSNQPEVGDEITVTGTVAEYFTLTELTFVTGYEVLSSGNALPDAFVGTAAQVNGEEYEGVLVQVLGATCVNTDSGYGQWIANDGSADLIVDDIFFDVNPTANLMYNIRGVMTYSFEEAKIEPRDEDDVEVVTSVEENNVIEVQLFPNPVTDNLKITFDQSVKMMELSIYSIEGKLVHNSTLTGEENIIDVSSLPKGQYTVHLKGESTEQSMQIRKI